MSVSAMAWAFERELPPTEKIVLLALADCENGQTHACMPGQDRIAAMSGMSVRSIQRVLTKLEERGLLRRDRRFNSRGYRTSDDYILALRYPDGFPAEIQGDNLSGGESLHDNGGNPYTTTVSGTKEPEEEPEVTPPTPSASNSFDEVWGAWPKKEGKKVAERCWSKLSAKKRAEIKPILLAHAAHHAKHTEAQYRPRLSTWLREERWDDEMPSAPAPANRGPQPTMANNLTVPIGKKLGWDEEGRPIWTDAS